MNSRSFNPSEISKRGIVRKLALVFVSLALITGCSKSEQLTLRNEEFPITAIGASGITGRIYIAENLDSTFTITVQLDRSVKDTVHIMNIYNGSQGSSSDVSVKLVDITGTGGPAIGETRNIRQVIQNTGNYESVNYDQIISSPRMLRVFYSQNRPDSLIATATIGQ